MRAGIADNASSARTEVEGVSEYHSRRPAEELQLPFRMEMKRPRKVRLEVQFDGQAAMQVYDGTNGWKLRPFLNGHDFEPFSEEELKIASYQEDLDGPLVDYAAKGSQVELDGAEKVEGRETYKLKVTEKSGEYLPRVG